MYGVFLDIETNGLDPYRHIPLEIALAILNLHSGQSLCEYHTVIRSDALKWNESDERSLSVNGFTERETLQGAPKQVVAEEIEQIFRSHSIRRGRAFFICQNPSFDRPFFGQIISAYRQETLLWPYHWLDLASMYWAKQLSEKQQVQEFNLSVSKDAIASSFGLANEARPHRAQNGVNHLVACYRALMKM